MSERGQPVWLRWVARTQVRDDVAGCSGHRILPRHEHPPLQAVEMANVARERSQDPLIRQLAFDIETEQLEQVGRMKGWLSLWNKPAILTGAPMGWVSTPGRHTEHGQRMTMPGMASDQDLDRLRALTGVEFDKFFLQLMIRHSQVVRAQRAET